MVAYNLAFTPSQTGLTPLIGPCSGYAGECRAITYARVTAASTRARHLTKTKNALTALPKADGVHRHGRCAW